MEEHAAMRSLCTIVAVHQATGDTTAKLTWTSVTRRHVKMQPPVKKARTNIRASVLLDGRAEYVTTLSTTARLTPASNREFAQMQSTRTPANALVVSKATTVMLTLMSVNPIRASGMPGRMAPARQITLTQCTLEKSL